MTCFFIQFVRRYIPHGKTLKNTALYFPFVVGIIAVQPSKSESRHIDIVINDTFLYWQRSFRRFEYRINMLYSIKEFHPWTLSNSISPSPVGLALLVCVFANFLPRWLTRVTTINRKSILYLPLIGRRWSCFFNFHLLFMRMRSQFVSWTAGFDQ